MKDNEIIKALEYCCKVTNCEVDCDRKTDCILLHLHEAVGLINRKDEMINGLIAGQETLQKHLAEKNAEIARYKGVIKLLEKDVATAREEFAERVKQEINFPLYVWKRFDDILKEMEGETNGK